MSIRREIPIRDYNDNNPQFIGRPYRANISEMAAIGTEVTLTPPIIVTDIDDGVNAECTVECKAFGQICDNFRINTFKIGNGNYTTRITLRKPLDFETQPTYVLKLIARDNAANNRLSAEASITISVIDVQDQVPVFLNAPYSASLPENTPADVSILTISAMDGDTENPRAVKLTLEDKEKHFFKLNQISPGKAILTTTNNPLDREELKVLQNGGVYSFNVTATEIITDYLDGDSSMTQVMIILKDVDDNLPAFNQKNFHVTIPENLEQGTPIPGLMIVVNDPDLSENSKYNLSLRNIRNSDQVFSLSPTYGEGRTPVIVKVLNESTLDYDVGDSSQKEYEFEILASVNGQEVATARVLVDLDDVNDNAPEFKELSMTAEVKEDVAVGTNVLDVTATDRDSGRFADISYILKGFGSENFYTDVKKGGLYVKKKLDYEQQKSFSMSLVAIDGGQREAALNLFINVVDVNDNYPMFDALEYTRTIREGATAFEPQFYVHATDIDGPNQGDGKLFYTIDSENSISGHEFLIDSETGEIKIANRVSSMDTERGQYELVVSARDFGVPPLSNNTRIVIRVGISGNQRPIFKTGHLFKHQDFPGPIPFKVTIPENAKRGDNVTKITATDPDGIDALLEYKILGANDNFEINRNGLITLSPNSRLDRDSMMDQYNVVVVAIDAGFPFPETATTTVQVSISDVNDEPPRFLRQGYTSHISERAEIGSNVINVTAKDPDLNSELSYSIIEPISALSKSGLKLNEESAVDFKHAMTINDTTGRITLNRTLDSSIVSVIVLTVQVEDLNAQPNQKPQKTTTEVTIYVQSFKEIDPVFKIPMWTSATPVVQKTIKEEIPIGQTIMTLEAEDPETHDQITYFKVVENNNEFLQLHEGTGELIVSQRLDYEVLERPFFNITVQAINLENNRHSIVVVNITVENVNDNDPIFTSKIYNATITESQKYPDKIVTVKAVDNDKVLIARDMELGYGSITYSILGHMSNYFTIDNNTGVISIAPTANIDREQNSLIKFQVQAEDAPTQPNESRRTLADVIVNVLDVNDNAPQFQMKSYSTVVPENVRINSQVLKLTATDPDEGFGGEIYYDIFNEGDASGLLRIDHNTGAVYTKTKLTGKGRSEPYEVVIRAQDKGNQLPKQESLYSDVSLSLHIGDISSNDGVPFFVAPKIGHIANITENSPPNTPVFQVIASDPDSAATPSGMLHYKVLGNTKDAELFAIDQYTGLIVSRISFDREVKSSYTIIIEVSDRGAPPLAVSRVLQINILDVDDHTPRFIRGTDDSPKPLSIDEELPIGTQIATLEAIDEDVGSNGAIDYTIISGNREGHFEIERQLNNSAILKTTIPLDREQQENYLLTIKCYKLNNTMPRIKNYNKKDFTETQLLITIVDVDDHLPQFKTGTSDIGVRHNIAPDTLLTTLLATDEDSTALPIAYQIGNISYTPQFYKRHIRPESLDSLFSLNNATGELKTANNVHDFVDGFFTVVISAQNSPNPQRHQNITLKIFIIREKSLLKFVFTKAPIDVRSEITQFYVNLQKKLQPLELHLFSPEAQVKSDLSLDFTSTSVCFQLSRHGSAISPQQMEKLLNEPDLLAQLTQVYTSYSVAAIEPCSTKRMLTAASWVNSSGVWLVALAGFIGVIALIASCVSCCILKKYEKSLIYCNS